MSNETFFMENNPRMSQISQEKLKKLDNEIIKRDEKISELNDKVAEKNDRLSRLATNLTHYKKEYDAYKKRDEKYNFNNLIAKNEELKKRLNDNENIINDNENTISEIKAEYDILESKLLSINKMIEFYKEENSRLNRKLNDAISDSKKNLKVKFFKYNLIAYATVMAMGVIYFIGSFILMNPNIFKVTGETISFITNFYNILILFLIPFFFGALSAYARLCLSEVSLRKGAKLIMASGLMATFSWVGIKSKLFVALLIPYLEAKPSIGEAMKNIDITEFYSMVLVSIIVGMFASNLFVFIDNKAKMLKLESKVNANSTESIDKNNTKNHESHSN